MYGRTTSLHDHSVQCSQDHVAGGGGQHTYDSMDSDLDDDSHSYHHFLHGMTDDMKHCLRDLMTRMDFTTMSTSFSGIDSPGTAFEMIHRVLKSEATRLNHGNIPSSSSSCDATTSSRHLWGVEWNNACQQQLLQHPHGPRCLFANIEAFLMPRVRCQLKQYKDQGKIESTLIPLLMEESNQVVNAFGDPVGTIGEYRTHPSIILSIIKTKD